MRMISTKQRDPRGSMVALAMVGLLPLLIAFGAFAVEMMHINAVQSELQKACDAGALAGAQYLYKYYSSGGPAAIEARARTVSGLNLADGRFVLDSSPNTTVTVNIVAPTLTPVAKGGGGGSGSGGVSGKGSGKGAGGAAMGGTVRVSATIGIDNMFAKIFSRPIETVNATALAGPVGGASAAGGAQTFPMAVSVNAPGPDGTLISSKQVGDTVQLGWQQNVAWTGPASQVSTQMTQYMQPGTGGTPPIRVGDNINLNNGMQAGNISQMGSNFVNEIINMPVFQQAAPAFNGNVPVIGFISIQVTGISGSVITGKLVVGTFTGATGYVPPSTVTPTEDDWLRDLATQPIKLLE